MTTSKWLHGVNGDFNDGSKWTAGVPAAGDTALLTVSGPAYTVTSSQFNTLGTLEMAKNATLNINALFVSLTSGTGTGALAGTIDVADEATLMLGTDGNSRTFSNTGAINLQSLGDTTDLMIAGTVTLTGKGTINLGSGGGSTIVSDGFAATLTNGSATSGNTISGIGTIGDSHLSFVNGAKGIIENTVGGTSLSIDTSEFTNSGLLEAIGKEGTNARLDIESDITQTAKGEIKAGIGAGNVELDSATITGGLVSTVKGSLLQSVAGASVLESQTKPIANAGEIAAFGGDLFITSAIKNSSTGNLAVANGNLLDITGTVTGGTASIGGTSGASTAQLTFEGPSSAKVSFDEGTPDLLYLVDPAQFTGTVAGMSSNSDAAIDLANIPFADGPVVSPLSAAGVLTVTDPVSHVVDKIKIVGGGTFNAQLGITGSTEITDPPAKTNLVVQSMASFGAGSAVAGSGTASVPEHHTSSDFLAANSHHG